QSSLERECLDMLQLTSALNGRLVTAREYDARSHRLARANGQLYPSTVRRLAHGYIAFLRGDLRKAYHILQRTEDDDGPAIAAAALLRVWLTMALGRPADAYQQLRSEPSLIRALPTRIQVGLLATEAELELQLGRPHSALRLLDEQQSDDADPVLEL